MIHDSQYDFYGTRFATCSSDGTVNIFDVTQQNNKPTATFKVRESPLWSLSWAHPRFGNIIAVSSFDGEVSVWKETRTNEWHKIACHTSQASVNSLKWAPENHDLILISGSSDGCITEFRRNSKTDEFSITNQWPAHESGVNAVAWAQEGEQLTIASGSADKTIKIWEIEQHQEEYHLKQTLDGHKEMIRDVQWHPFNTFLASCSEDGVVIIWKTESTENLNFSVLQEIQVNFNAWRVEWSKIVGEQLVVSGYHNGETVIQLYEFDESGELKLIQEVEQVQK